MMSARRSQVLSRRHQFSILEPCSRAIIAARALLPRARSAAAGADASSRCRRDAKIYSAWPNCFLELRKLAVRHLWAPLTPFEAPNAI